MGRISKEPERTCSASEWTAPYGAASAPATDGDKYVIELLEKAVKIC
jgi:hypothetical protein